MVYTTTNAAQHKQQQHHELLDKPITPAIRELAFQRYGTEYSLATICEPLKLKIPFQCNRNVEVPATTRLSLSVAAAQAEFAMAGIVLVVLHRKPQNGTNHTFY